MFILEVKIDRNALQRECKNQDAYLCTLPMLQNADQDGVFRLTFQSPVTFVVGENGMGKSTLMEALAIQSGLNPEGGSKNFVFSTRASHSSLERFMSLSRSEKRPKDAYFLRAESYFNVATHMEHLDDAPMDPSPKIVNSYGGVSLHEQSHGESFMALLQNRFFGNGLYLLDEPEAALSPTRLMAMLVLIRDLVRKGSQFIISTHSPILMAYPGAQIYQITEEGMRDTPYQQTDAYLLTKRFLNDPQSMIAKIMADDEMD